MRYIHTTSDVITRGPAKNVIRPYVKNYLYSLINGLSSESFGFNTVDRVTQEVKRFYEDLYEDEILFVDSAGYSIIVGDIPPTNINMFIECYHYFLEKYAPLYCDHMFSLDIPIFLKYPEVNTYTNLYKRNYRSCQLSKHILDQNPDLYNKFIYVYQFKIFEQYDIWNRLYQEFWEKENRLKHFAIGGLVGLRGITGIKFSPFIAMIYKLLNFVYEKNLNEESILHVLGVYGLHDRFHLAFLHRLFNDVYLKDRNCTANVSYDTINYFVSGLFKIRELDSVIPHQGKYLNDLNVNLLEYIENIIKYPDALNEVKRNIVCLQKNQSLHDTILYSYMNIVRQLIVDQIMRDVIKEYDLINQFLQYNNFNSFKNNMRPLFKSLEIKYPFVFKNYTDKIMNNFQWICSLHDWWLSGRDKLRLERGLELFIQKINFPKAIVDDRG